VQAEGGWAARPVDAGLTVPRVVLGAPAVTVQARGADRSPCAPIAGAFLSKPALP